MISGLTSAPLYQVCLLPPDIRRIISRNISSFLLAELAFYNFLPKKTYYLLNGTSIQGIGWASGAGGLPPV
jgi:hypothetical protein